VSGGFLEHIFMGSYTKLGSLFDGICGFPLGNRGRLVFGFRATLNITSNSTLFLYLKTMYLTF
jgi:hypothetical protein